MLKRFLFSFIAGIIVISSETAVAGNHEVIHPSAGHSIGWVTPTNIPYWIDLGPLGRLDNEQARMLVEKMLGVWDAVPTAEVGFEFRGYTPEDVTIENVSDYINAATCGNENDNVIPDDIVPIVFDTDGKMIDFLVGAGSSSEVGGISTLRCFKGSTANPTGIYQAMIFINGQFIDGLNESDATDDLSVNGLAGVILHELGHMIGLDHTALNEEIYDGISSGNRTVDDSRYLPIMLPTVLRSSTSFTVLHPDDIATLSVLYPAGDYLNEVGDIEGEIVDSNGEDVRKVNVIARNVADPLCEAVSAVTGRYCVPLKDYSGRLNFNATTCFDADLYGNFRIEGVSPGTYTVEVEELDGGWIRKGMYPSSVNNDLPGDAEFYNDSDTVSEDPFDLTEIAVNGGEVVAEVNITLNDSVSNLGQMERIPLSTFTRGPGTRCTSDPLNYADVIVAGNLDIAQFPEPVADDGDGGGDGGCQLVSGVPFSFRSIYMLLSGLMMLAFLGLFRGRQD